MRTEPRPGQLWRWVFDVNGDGWWIVSRVTEQGRTQLLGSYMTLKLGDLVTVVTLNDPGPYQSLNLDEYGLIAPRKRWHVALLNDALIWVEDAWFDDANIIELVRDVG